MDIILCFVRHLLYKWFAIIITLHNNHNKIESFENAKASKCSRWSSLAHTQVKKNIKETNLNWAWTTTNHSARVLIIVIDFLLPYFGTLGCSNNSSTHEFLRGPEMIDFRLFYELCAKALVRSRKGGCIFRGLANVTWNTRKENNHRQL